jgi:uncharacterized protein
MNNHITLPREQIADFCRRRHIRRLAIFGSALRSDFNESSDIDVLVEFEPEHIPGLFGMARIIWLADLGVSQMPLATTAGW